MVDKIVNGGTQAKTKQALCIVRVSTTLSRAVNGQTRQKKVKCASAEWFQQPSSPPSAQSMRKSMRNQCQRLYVYKQNRPNIDSIRRVVSRMNKIN